MENEELIINKLDALKQEIDFIKEHLIDVEYKDKNGKTKMKKGITFNPFLKGVCWKIGESIVKAGGEYREIYDGSRESLDREHEKEITIEGKAGKYYTKGHKYSMAKRKAVKRVLADFWVEWMRTAGHVPSDPYAHRGDGIMPQSIYNYKGKQYTCGCKYWEALKGKRDPKKFSAQALDAMKNLVNNIKIK